MFGGVLFSRIPKPSNSYSNNSLCFNGFVTSNTIKISEHVLATKLFENKIIQNWRNLSFTRNDLSSSSLSVLGTFNDSWQVEQLDFGTLVADESGDCGESCEFILGHFGIDTRDVGQQCGFADRGKTLIKKVKIRLKWRMEWINYADHLDKSCRWENVAIRE